MSSEYPTPSSYRDTRTTTPGRDSTILDLLESSLHEVPPQALVQEMKQALLLLQTKNRTLNDW